MRLPYDLHKAFIRRSSDVCGTSTKPHSMDPPMGLPRDFQLVRLLWTWSMTLPPLCSSAVFFAYLVAVVSLWFCLLLSTIAWFFLGSPCALHLILFIFLALAGVRYWYIFLLDFSFWIARSQNVGIWPAPYTDAPVTIDTTRNSADSFGPAQAS